MDFRNKRHAMAQYRLRVVSADDPPFVQEQWRVMGMWRDGRIFLVVLGRDKVDCQHRLDLALEDYDYEDFLHIESLWFERFLPPDLLRDVGAWWPMEEFSFRRYRTLHSGERLVSA